ncbi:hypothetical protein CSKR_100147, partial [Clonorchis sinensis]
EIRGYLASVQAADEDMKRKLSETLLQTLLYLKEQIITYLAELVNKLSSWISSLDGNQMQAKGVAAITVLDAFKNIDDFLKQELPKLG